MSGILRAQDDTCIDFEDIDLGNTFANGTSLVEDGVLMTIGPYESPDGPIAFGSGTIVNSSPHEGRSLALSNATVEFSFTCVQELTLVFGNNGGNINISINGEKEVIKTLESSYQIGGVNVATTHGGTTGTMAFTFDTSNINSLCVGGQEFRVDHICFLPCDDPDCFDFEDLGPNPLKPGDRFDEDGLTIGIIPFEGNNGTVSAGNGNNAGHLGNEILIQGAGIAFMMECSSGIAFTFEQSQDGVEITVNGETITVRDMEDLGGQMVGGATILVKDNEVFITGFIEDIAIAGAGLAIDHLCRGECPMNCIDFEEEMVGTKYFESDTLTEDGVTMTVENFQGTDGTLVVEDQNRAGHVGHDVGLEDAILRFDIPCASEITLHFGQYDSGVFLAHRNGSTSVSNLAALNGMELDGVMIKVEGVQGSGAYLGTLTLSGEISEFAIGGLNLALDHICYTPCPDPSCFDFETFPFGKIYQDGESLTEDLTAATLSRYNAANPGTLQITGGNLAGGVGNEAYLTNCMATFHYLCASRVEILFTRPTSGVRLGVNGSFVNSTGFSTFNGQTVGGFAVTVANGKITIEGEGITEVSVGGAGTIIDSICHEDCLGGPNCEDFEGLMAGHVYEWLDSIENEDLFMLVDTFYYSNGDSEFDGTITVGTGNQAGHQGKELRFSTSTLLIVPNAGCMEQVSFYFAELSGNVNLTINGEETNIADFAMLDGTSLGGVGISVNTIALPGGGTRGYASFDGYIVSMTVGGQNFALDHLCYENCPPISLGTPVLVSSEAISATEREIIIDIELDGPGVLRMQESTDLGRMDNWSNLSTTVTDLTGDWKRCRAVVPLDRPADFFRIRANYL